MTLDHLTDLAASVLTLLGAVYVLVSLLASVLPARWRLTRALAVVAADLRRILPARASTGTSLPPSAAPAPPPAPEAPDGPPRA